MARRVIQLLGAPIHNEEKAAEAITPGHLLTVNGSGFLIKHASAGADCPRWFADMRDEMGKDIDDAYAVDDQAKFLSCAPGQRVNAIIASGVNAVKGNFMESAGDGTLRVFSAGVKLAVCVESVNNTNGNVGTGPTPTSARCPVEIY